MLFRSSVLGGLVQNFQQTAGTNTVSGSGSVTGTATISGGLFDLNGATYSNGLMVLTSTLTNAVAGATFNGGLTNAGTVAVTANTFINGVVTNTGGFFFQGAISNALVNSGSFNLNNNATLTAAPVNTGTIAAGANTLTVNPSWSNAGTVTVAGGAVAGGTLTNTGAIVGSGALNAVVNSGNLLATNGTLTVTTLSNAAAGVVSLRSAGTLTGGVITNSGTIAAVAGGNIGGVFNSAAGTIQATNGTLTFLANTLNAGTLNVSATVKFGAANELVATNNGVINLLGGTILDKDLFNRGRIVTVAGGGVISNALINDVGGFIISTNGTLVLTPDLGNLGVITNTATLIVSNVPAASLGVATNSGTIVLGGGTFSAASLTNTGVVLGNGTLGAALINQSGGALRATNGTLNVTGAVTQQGAVDVASGATLNVTPAWANAGTVNLAGGTLIGGTFTNAGTLVGFGSITPAVVNAGTFSIAAGQTLTLAGATFSNAPNAVLQNAAGTIAMTANNANFIMTPGLSSNTFSFAAGTLQFSGATGTRLLTLGGIDNGSLFAATNNNYFVGNLQLSGGAGYTLQLAGNAGQALYVDNLLLTSGATLNLAGYNIYYKTAVQTNGVTFLNGSGANLIRLGTGGVFLFVPTSGTQDFDTAANWDRGLTPSTPIDQVRITTAAATSMTVTQNTGLGALTISDLVISNGGGGVYTLNLQRNQTWVNGGTIDTGGKIVVSNGVVLTSALTVNGGTLNNNGTVSGLITIAGGTADGRYTNSGFIVVNSGTLAGFVLNQAAGVITNAGTVATTGILTNNGLLVNSGGISNAVANAGNLELRGGDVRGGIVNTSVITVTNGTASISGGITNAATGNIYLTSAGTLTGGVVTNTGTIAAVAGGNIGSVVNNTGATLQATNGTLSVLTSLKNTGTLNVNAGKLAVTPDWSNAGTIALEIGRAHV